MGWIKTIAQGVEKAFNAVRKPLGVGLPPILLICELKNRPGLSAIALTSAIIRRLPEAGIESGVNPDGSPNKINKLIRIMCEEFVNEIKNNARVTTVIPPGAINTIGQGATSGGPVVVTSINTIANNIFGLIQ